MTWGQTHKYRYWFDDNYKSAVTASTKSLNWTINPSVANLSYGLHTINVQTESKGVWSAPVVRFFLKSNATLGTARWWVDEGERHTLAAADATGEVILDMSTVAEGFHILHYQLLDTKGKVRSESTSPFLKTIMPQGSFHRYWFDSDDSHAVEVKTNDTSSTISLNADVSALNYGLHSITIQSRNGGPWTAPITAWFIKDATTVGSARWWVDNGPVTVLEGDAATGEMLLDMSGIEQGFHQLNYELLDSHGLVHSTMSRWFLKSFMPAGSTFTCWVDNDTIPLATGEVTNEEMLFDVSHLSDGLHTLHITVNSSGMCLTETRRFIKTPVVAGETTLTCVVSIDGREHLREDVAATGGVIDWNLDVSEIAPGLHHLNIQVITPNGSPTSSESAYFIKIPNGGDGIVRWDYWINEHEDDIHTTYVEGLHDPFEVDAFLEVGHEPLRTSSFHFDATGTQPILYAKNQIHARFENVAGRTTEMKCDFIDETVSEPVTTIGDLFAETAHTNAKPADGTILWWAAPLAEGDYLELQTNRQCTLNVFTPDGREVYHAEGSAAMTMAGFEAPEASNYYIALHDQTQNGDVTLTYTYDKWVIPDLTLALTTDTVAEGQALVVNVGRTRLTRQPVDIAVTSSLSGRLTLPSVITIPAGKESVGVRLATVDDEVYTAPRELTLSVSSERHNPAECHVIIVDNELPMDENQWQLLRQWNTAQQGPQWNNKWTFADNSVNTDQPYGVTMRDGQVIGISLANNKLGGEFSPLILSLPSLESIDLSRNQLSGDLVTLLQDNAVNTAVHSIDLSHNQLSGDLASIGKLLPQVTRLNASYNQIEEVSEALPEGITSKTLDMSHQTIGRQLTMSDLSENRDHIIDAMPSVMLYNGDSNSGYYDDHATMTLSDGNGWRATLVAGPEWAVTGSGRQVWTHESGTTVTATTSKGSHTATLAVDFGQGDTDFDYLTDIVDLQKTVNFSMNDNQNGVFNLTSADLMADGFIDLLDVVRMVNLLLSDIAPLQVKGYHRAPARISEDESPRASMYIEDGKLMLFTMRPVAAMDIVIEADNGRDIHWEANNMTMTRKDMGPYTHLIIYSLKGNEIESGETILATMGAGEARIVSAQLVERDATRISTKIGDDTVSTGISDIDSDSKLSGDDGWYTLGGIRLGQRPSHPGVYIHQGRRFVITSSTIEKP